MSLRNAICLILAILLSAELMAQNERPPDHRLPSTSFYTHFLYDRSFPERQLKGLCAYIRENGAHCNTGTHNWRSLNTKLRWFTYKLPNQAEWQGLYYFSKNDMPIPLSEIHEEDLSCHEGWHPLSSEPFSNKTNEVDPLIKGPDIFLDFANRFEPVTIAAIIETLADWLTDSGLEEASSLVTLSLPLEYLHFITNHKIYRITNDSMVFRTAGNGQVWPVNRYCSGFCPLFADLKLPSFTSELVCRVDHFNNPVASELESRDNILSIGLISSSVPDNSLLTVYCREQVFYREVFRQNFYVSGHQVIPGRPFQRGDNQYSELPRCLP